MRAEDAFELGFDHIAMAAGAGRPTVLELPNGLARGVRTASDFLMALQLTGAAKTDSVANLQIRLPVVVIGGGLTAIDTATESAAYYPLQVEKFLARYETLAAERSSTAVRKGWSEEENAIADEFLAHARALRAERAAAKKEGRPARIAELLQSWGGVTIAYRKRLIDSPSYTLNHEEVEKALEEGIRFAEGLSPLAVEVDRYGHASGLKVAVRMPDANNELQPAAERVLPARTILVAAGTQPNTVASREDPAHFPLDGRYFQAVDEGGKPGEAAAQRQAGARRSAAGARTGRPLHQLLRRSASVLLRQRRQGDGRGQAGLPAGEPRTGDACAGLAAVRCPVHRPPQRRAARHRARGGPAHAHHRRGRRARSDGGAPFPARPVLSPAELRAQRGQRRRHAAGHGRAWR